MPTLLQIGIYTVPEASRLTRVSPWRIRRWLRGYEFKSKRGRHHSPAVWKGEIEPIDHSMALGFLDLLEIKSVDALLREGVSWKTIRQAYDKAQRLFDDPHPFCTNRFATDGRDIFVELKDQQHGAMLLDIAKVQRVFERVIQPFLRNLDFADGKTPIRWWPRGQEHRVAVDPRRNFGQPTIFNDGVPTGILARSAKANGSLALVARWFEVSVRTVREAVEFEQQLAA